MAVRLEPEQFAQVVAARHEQDRDPASTLCVACVEVLGVAGAGLVLMSGGRSLDFIGVSDAVSEAVEQMEYTLGEGPCVSAFHTKVPVFDADLADERGAAARWPEFRRGALAAGVRAAFGFPLLIEHVCIGALNLYHDQPGALSEDQVADAVVVARCASRSVMGWQADAPAGTVAWQLEAAPSHRVEVHQATGRISVQVGVSLDDALVLLRAYAFSHDRPIGDVAADIAAGRLSLA
ncbi:MAG: GAF and ANTAR domain-containing protein [Acidimicrobiia bacterium]